MFFRCLHADFYKLRRSPVIAAHIVIPIMASLAFLFYYGISGRSFSETEKIIVFYQTIGAAFPILIGIFTASTMEQEQNAGAFQNLLTLKCKTAALFSKVVVLILLSFIALLFTAVLFGYGFESVLGQGSMGIALYIEAALVMWLSAIPLYLIFEILALLFGKGVSIGAGLFSGLISALFLTNLGMYVWKIVPLSWTARMPDTYLELRFGELSTNIVVSKIRQPQSHMIYLNLKPVLNIYLLFTVVCLACYFVFAANYEGSKTAD
ncbi:lantibiotic immunity ABC transporter MutG family permease subunit [Butyrivibrio sp. VCD2006]|uniref:lantibiotic immunity ABC transporter MutG family permease subunit n=1 Tax=Butyrivibrio sp. VCD2006 TaxID=1280664 RepID=UPI00041B9EEC|nr:lantibiotic immunity ABC transporter MutG family permease subunit [Butyrivibrio sp. VCD2006]